MKDQYQVQCPSCDHQFNVEEAIAKQIKSNLDISYQERESKLKNEFKEKLDKLSERESKLQLAEEEQEKMIVQKVKERETATMEKLKKQLAEQYESKMGALQEENEENAKKIKVLNDRERNLLKREREVRESQETLELEFEKKLSKERERLSENLNKGFEERKALALQEKEILIGQLKKQIDDMKKKTDQGSMQVQGEAQELVLENILRNRFPHDSIQEVPKGISGADCIQMVCNEFGKECGSIVYESKRTKNFSNDWIPKLKQDTLKVKGNISVIVTEAMPESIQGIGQMEGVWITNFENLPFLALTLRFAIQKEFQAMDHQINKGDKMQMLYDYLTSEEFRMQMNTIIDGFTGMKANLEKQKRSMMANWKTQEKEIERVIESTVHMYGSVRGIAGSAIEPIEELELEGNASIKAMKRLKS